MVRYGAEFSGLQSCFSPEDLEYACYKQEDVKLVHAPDGQYPGPWF